jgi:hypothetical protein
MLAIRTMKRLAMAAVMAGGVLMVTPATFAQCSGYRTYARAYTWSAARTTDAAPTYSYRSSYQGVPTYTPAPTYGGNYSYAAPSYYGSSRGAAGDYNAYRQMFKP